MAVAGTVTVARGFALGAGRRVPLLFAANLLAMACLLWRRFALFGSLAGDGNASKQETATAGRSASRRGHNCRDLIFIGN